MVFVQIEKKSGYRWYLWAFQSATAIAFELDPSRSHRVPDGHFQGVEGGILLVDRYLAIRRWNWSRTAQSYWPSVGHTCVGAGLGTAVISG